MLEWGSGFSWKVSGREMFPLCFVSFHSWKLTSTYISFEILTLWITNLLGSFGGPISIKKSCMKRRILEGSWYSHYISSTIFAISTISVVGIKKVSLCTFSQPLPPFFSHLFPLLLALWFLFCFGKYHNRSTI